MFFQRVRIQGDLDLYFFKLWRGIPTVPCFGTRAIMYFFYSKLESVGVKKQQVLVNLPLLWQKRPPQTT